MSVAVRCPGCGKLLASTEAMTGRLEIKCARCKQIVIVQVAPARC